MAALTRGLINSGVVFGTTLATQFGFGYVNGTRARWDDKVAPAAAVAGGFALTCSDNPILQVVGATLETNAMIQVIDIKAAGRNSVRNRGLRSYIGT